MLIAFFINFSFVVLIKKLLYVVVSYLNLSIGLHYSSLAKWFVDKYSLENYMTGIDKKKYLSYYITLRFGF